MTQGKTRSGELRGATVDGVRIFRGIPFAQPPIGALRFAAPQREASWSGVRDAQSFGPSAPQPPMKLPIPGMDVGATDEDCLYLNVYTPGCDTAGRPVLVWIHGGGFVIGSGSQTIYDATRLAQRGDVVVVTINYRLGPLGFLHLEGAVDELDGAVGNPGLRDQVAALEWVRDCIADFGGDPGNVTIFGESAGGMSVGSLLGMPAARGLFHKAIPQSGAAHNLHSPEEARWVAERFLQLLGAKSIAELRAADVEALHGASARVSMEFLARGGMLPFMPALDGDLFPEHPLDAIRAGIAADVPLLVGSTREEWKLFGLMDPGLKQLDEAGLMQRLRHFLPDVDLDALVARYRSAAGAAAPSPADLFIAIQSDRVFRIPAVRLAEAQLAHQPQTYMYRFDWQAPLLGACHAVDLPFVFGLAGNPEAALFAGGDGEQAKRLALRTMDAWIAFARTGDPHHDGLDAGRWQRYCSERRRTMLLGPDCSSAEDPGRIEREAWAGIL